MAGPAWSSSAITSAYDVDDFTWTVPAGAVGDLLICWGTTTVGHLGSGNSISEGWTFRGKEDFTTNSTTWMAYKVRTSVTETNPTFATTDPSAGAFHEWTACCLNFDMQGSLGGGGSGYMTELVDGSGTPPDSIPITPGSYSYTNYMVGCIFTRMALGEDPPDSGTLITTSYPVTTTPQGSGHYFHMEYFEHVIEIGSPITDTKCMVATQPFVYYGPDVTPDFDVTITDPNGFDWIFQFQDVASDLVPPIGSSRKWWLGVVGWGSTGGGGSG